MDCPAQSSDRRILCVTKYGRQLCIPWIVFEQSSYMDQADEVLFYFEVTA